MDKNTRFTTDRPAIVKAARNQGKSDAQILSLACSGRVYAERRQIIKEWASPLGLTEAQALDLAQKESII